MNQSLLVVTKRDGRTERINLDKFIAYWAAEGISQRSRARVEPRSHIQFYDGI